MCVTLSKRLLRAILVVLATVSLKMQDVLVVSFEGAECFTAVMSLRVNARLICLKLLR